MRSRPAAAGKASVRAGACRFGARKRINTLLPFAWSQTGADIYDIYEVQDTLMVYKKLQAMRLRGWVLSPFRGAAPPHLRGSQR